MFVEGNCCYSWIQVSYSDKVHSTTCIYICWRNNCTKSFYNATTPVIVTGATSGIQAKVIGYQDATATTQPILILQYLNTGSDNETVVFQRRRKFISRCYTTITHTSSYGS